jgi:hypothetical protein
MILTLGMLLFWLFLSQARVHLLVARESGKEL